MAWLKLDDGFARHPKVLALPEVKRWRWVVLLVDCARHNGGRGKVTAGMLEAVDLQADELVVLELLDVEGDSWRVHDWDEYNPADNAASDRQKRYRLRRAGVPEDEVLRRVPLRGDGHGNPALQRYVVRDVTRDDIIEGAVTATLAQESQKIRKRDVTRDDIVDVAGHSNTRHALPVPSRPVPKVNPSAGRARDEPAGELDAEIARLIALLPDDPTSREYVATLAGRTGRKSPDRVRRAVELVGAGVLDPIGCALVVLNGGEPV